MTQDQKEYSKKYYKQNKDKIREYYLNNKERIDKYRKDWERNNANSVTKSKRKFNRIKTEYILNSKGNKCARCGIEYDGTNSCIFECHHLNPKEKEHTVRQLRKEFLDDELKKCILLCANCHKMTHHGKIFVNGDVE
jgi:hypothetical protein